MLQTLFFDIDDTLYSSTDFAWSAREAAVRAMIDLGVRADPELVMKELREVVEEFSSNDDRHYDRLLERLPRAAIHNINKELVVTGGVIAYHTTKWEMFRISEDAEELLRDLSQTKLSLGIISAGITKKQMEKVLRLKLLRFVEPNLVFITDQQGIAKTNVKLYQRAARIARVSPREAMHVGDHPLRDVQTAKRAGMLATLVAGSGKYGHLVSDPPPDHIIDNVAALRSILDEQYQVFSN